MGRTGSVRQSARSRRSLRPTAGRSVSRGTVAVVVAVVMDELERGRGDSGYDASAESLSPPRRGRRRPKKVLR